jgi:hypothetical protein
VTTAVKPKAPVGRPKTPRDIADQQLLNRIAALAYQILSCLRQPGHEMYDSERMLRGWLTDAGIQFTADDLRPALLQLAALGFIGRGPDKGNSARAGWLVGAADAPVWTSASPEPGTALEDEPAEPGEDVTATAADVPEPTDEQRIDALATAITRAFTAGRGYQGNRRLCESETVLREWLTEDGVIIDEAGLPAALTRLETATLPGSNSRLLRGYALHRSYPITSKPLPPRSMLLMTLHPLDSTTYEPADIEPYVV